MEIKTAQEILDEMQQCDDGCAITDGTHYDSKWVNLDELMKCIDDTYRDLDMGKTIPIFIERLKEKLKQ